MAEFKSNLRSVKEASHEALLRVAEVIGGMAESKAKQKIAEVVYQAPAGWYVRTGNLRNSITHALEDNTDSVTVVIGSNVEYAPFVELGTGKFAESGEGRQTPWRYQDDKGNWHTTSGMPPRPFLRPAIEDHKEEYKNIMLKEMKP